jgi:hypothetical protein
VIKTLTFLKAAPYVLGLLLLATGGAYLKGRGDGYAKAEREHEAAGVADLIDAVKTAAQVGEAVLEIGRELRDALAKSRAHETESVRTVTRIVREHPEFAAVRRPPELQRLRDAQLERIQRATETD